MRLILLAVTMAGAISGLMGQTITEFGAAAAGGTVGGAAGKKVSDGITNIFEKVDQHASAASATAAPKATTPAKPVAPLLSVSPGVVGTGTPAGAAPQPNTAPRVAARVPVAQASVTDSVPPPPPLPGETIKRVAAPPKLPPPVALVPVEPPPPPPVTPEDVRALTVGQGREDVLKIGAASARITMFEDGHLLEIYRYMAGDATFGVVRVIDGAVSQVEVR